ncbi:MAG: hypothetical protein AAF376_14260 [Pseudomonadota bacterium]
MQMNASIRAERAVDQDMGNAGCQSEARKRPTREKRAPRRIWAQQQAQDGASMEYQLGFTSGPLT